jgi:hypothetical protein
MVAGMEHHPAVRRVTSTPVARAFEEIAKHFVPSYYHNYQKFKATMGMK